MSTASIQTLITHLTFADVSALLIAEYVERFESGFDCACYECCDRCAEILDEHEFCDDCPGGCPAICGRGHDRTCVESRLVDLTVLTFETVDGIVLAEPLAHEAVEGHLDMADLAAIVETIETAPYDVDDHGMHLTEAGRALLGGDVLVAA